MENYQIAKLVKSFLPFLTKISTSSALSMPGTTKCELHYQPSFILHTERTCEHQCTNGGKLTGMKGSALRCVCNQQGACGWSRKAKKAKFADTRQDNINSQSLITVYLAKYDAPTSLFFHHSDQVARKRASQSFQLKQRGSLTRTTAKNASCSRSIPNFPPPSIPTTQSFQS